MHHQSVVPFMSCLHTYTSRYRGVMNDLITALGVKPSLAADFFRMRAHVVDTMTEASSWSVRVRHGAAAVEQSVQHHQATNSIVKKPKQVFWEMEDSIWLLMLRLLLLHLAVTAYCRYA